MLYYVKVSCAQNNNCFWHLCCYVLCPLVILSYILNQLLCFVMYKFIMCNNNWSIVIYLILFYTIHTDEWLVQKLIIMLIVTLFYLLSSFVIVKFYTSNYGRKVFSFNMKFLTKNISYSPRFQTLYFDLPISMSNMSDVCNISNNLMQVCFTNFH